MSGPALVFDTTFLRSLYGIFQRERDENKLQKAAARERLRGAIQMECRSFVPYPVVFETANGIAHIGDTSRRQALADYFVADVEKSVTDGEPWIITPHEGQLRELLARDELLELCREFRELDTDRRIGLSDLVILREAQRLKKKYADEGRPVYIWTDDVELKRREPDREPEGWWCATPGD